MDVTIIIPLHNPDKRILKKVREIIKKQDYSGEIKILEIDKNFGLAKSINYGLKRTKTEIVITLHQDCVPSSKEWLKKIVEPFKDKKVVASVSKVELPKKYWNKFDLIGKIFSAKEQKVITPLLDEKGCAYRRKTLEEINGFDEKTFRTAGEDFDIYFKLIERGRIAYPDCKVLHYHFHSGKNRMHKELQLSNGFGTLFRIHGKKMPSWKIGLVKSLPFLGWPIFIISFPYEKVGAKGILWIPLSLGANIFYSIGFWKGYIDKKQTI